MAEFLGRKFMEAESIRQVDTKLSEQEKQICGEQTFFFFAIFLHFTGLSR